MTWEVKLSEEFAPYQLILVGGAVLNETLGVEIKDYDMITDAPLEVILTKLDKLGYMTYEEGNSFKYGTVFAKAKLNRPYYSHIDLDLQISYRADLEADIHNRDFTVNRLQRRVGNGQWGGISTDFKDVQLRRIILCNGEQTLIDDPVRCVRAFRLEQKLRKNMPKETLELVNAYAHKLVDVPKERIRNELIKILEEPLVTSLPGSKVAEVVFKGMSVQCLNHSRLKGVLPALILLGKENDFKTVREWALEYGFDKATQKHLENAERAENYIKNCPNPQWGVHTRWMSYLSKHCTVYNCVLENRNLGSFMTQWADYKIPQGGNYLIEVTGLTGPKLGKLIKDLTALAIEEGRDPNLADIKRLSQ